MSQHHPKKIASDFVATYVIGLIIVALVVGPLLGGLADAINGVGNAMRSASQSIGR